VLLSLIVINDVFATSGRSTNGMAVLTRLRRFPGPILPDRAFAASIAMLNGD
jgi:hypothetical protein